MKTKVYVYCVTGTLDIPPPAPNQTAQNISTSFGTLDAKNEDEALGAAMSRFKKDKPEHKVLYWKVSVCRDLRRICK